MSAPTKVQALVGILDACLAAKPMLLHGQWRMSAVEFDRISEAIAAFHGAPDQRVTAAFELLRTLDRRGGLGLDVHERIVEIVGKEVGLGT